MIFFEAFLWSNSSTNYERHIFVLVDKVDDDCWLSRWKSSNLLVLNSLLGSVVEKKPDELLCDSVSFRTFSDSIRKRAELAISNTLGIHIPFWLNSTWCWNVLTDFLIFRLSRRVWISVYFVYTRSGWPSSLPQSWFCWWNYRFITLYRMNWAKVNMKWDWSFVCLVASLVWSFNFVSVFLFNSSLLYLISCKQILMFHAKDFLDSLKVEYLVGSGMSVIYIV